MNYTGSVEEHTEVGSLTGAVSLKRKLTGVRPAYMIVATSASREHAKETCAQRGTRRLAIGGWRY
jgi:hypothetical protein